MLPDIWGKYGWNFLHLVTVGYPERPTKSDMKKYRDFFMQLQYVLPCDKCKYNMGVHLKKYPLTDNVMANQSSLIKWGINLHNLVNQQTGKRVISHIEAIQYINNLVNDQKLEQFSVSTTTGTSTARVCAYTKYILVIAIIVIIVILCYYAMKKM